MIRIQYLFFFMVILLLSGCTAVNVRPVETESKIAHVCVKDCSDMCFEGDMMSIIRDGFDRHGITTQVYTDNLPSECKYHLTYFCERTWDMATYMHYAELKLFDGQNQIGYAEYRLKGKGGFSLMKWESTKDKMDPVIDQLLGEYPTVNMAPKKE